MGRAIRPHVQRHVAAKNGGRPVARVIVAEGAHSGEFRIEVTQAPRRPAGPFVITPAHGEPDAIALRNDNACRPHLDVEFIDFPRRQLLDLIVRVIGPVRQR